MLSSRLSFWALLALSGLAFAASGHRDAKLLSMFQVIRFDNGPCDGNNSQNGTCYTKQECEDRDGKDSGSCAEGFGVCCTFEVGCGSNTRENCTYFENTNPDAGSCKATICPVTDNICQLRLDFLTFELAGPAVGVDTIGKTLAGVVLKGGSKAVSQQSQCVTDSFSVSTMGAKNGVICGKNTGEHMYVEADEECNDLIFSLGDNAIGTTIPSGRGWNVKVTQLSCDHPLLPPTGCTQYYYGSTTGTIKTFNYDGGNTHLANQRQKICIRNEKGMCKACYSEAATGDFVLGDGGEALTKCCDYGTKGKDTKGVDCAQFDGTLFNAAATATVNAQNICGGKLNSMANAASGTVCQRANPFGVTFVSDPYEFTTEITTATKGFEVIYYQVATGCT